MIVCPAYDSEQGEQRTGVTVLLARVRDGDQLATGELIQVLYGELHRTAQQLMRRERQDHTLQPTVLVHEAFLKLGPLDGGQWSDRVHFLRVAARAMRQVLVDHARARVSEKRGGEGWQRVTLVDDLAIEGRDAAGLLLVDAALERLLSFDPELARIVEMRFFGGLEHAEIASVLAVSERTVQRGWRTARAWLHSDMERERDGC